MVAKFKLRDFYPVFLFFTLIFVAGLVEARHPELPLRPAEQGELPGQNDFQFPLSPPGEAESQ